MKSVYCIRNGDLGCLCARSGFVSPQIEFSAQDILALRHMTSAFSSPLKPIREQNLRFAFTFSKRIVASISASFGNRSRHHDSSSPRRPASSSPSSSRSHAQRSPLPLWLGLNPSISASSNPSLRPAPDNNHVLSAAHHFSNTIGSDICAQAGLQEDHVTFSVKQTPPGLSNRGVYSEPIRAFEALAGRKHLLLRRIGARSPVQGECGWRGPSRHQRELG